MNILQEAKEESKETVQNSSLLDLIAQWPDWKIQALCLDESDLKIKKVIQSRRLQNYQ